MMWSISNDTRWMRSIAPPIPGLRKNWARSRALRAAISEWRSDHAIDTGARPERANQWRVVRASFHRACSPASRSGGAMAALPVGSLTALR